MTNDNLQVEKKDGSLEPFDRAKTKASMVNAGASDSQAESLTTQIEGWAKQTAKEGVVKSSQIREKVLEVLRPVNPEAADAFEKYKKPA